MHLTSSLLLSFFVSHIIFLDLFPVYSFSSVTVEAEMFDHSRKKSMRKLYCHCLCYIVPVVCSVFFTVMVMF